jgi:hypothetical protein
MWADASMKSFRAFTTSIEDTFALRSNAGENGIRLRTGVAEFLRDYSRTLQLLAIGGWVRFTEQFTAAPRLYEKIVGPSS